MFRHFLTRLYNTKKNKKEILSVLYNMPSHNSKYYTKSLKTNTVKSHNIPMLFKKKNK